MGLRNILKRVFANDKKVVICGLDNAGKTTMVSFLQKGTFIEHTPTMGKQQTTIEVQGIRMNLIDLGGQKDFRSLWLGEMKNAQCVIFMLDAQDTGRFNEARKELCKLSSILTNKLIIVLANKYDLKPVASIEEIIKALDLMKLKSFEVIPISSKTGYGIVNAFSKIYSSLTGSRLTKRIMPKAITVFDQGGVPLITTEGVDRDASILRGGLFAAITSFVKESFNSELNQLKLENNLIIVQRSKHLMGSIVIEGSDKIDAKEAEVGLHELLEHLENMCPELEKNQTNSDKIEYLVQQFSTNIFN